MTYSNDYQLREEDADVLKYSGRSGGRKHKRAATDLERDLLAHGYLRGDLDQYLDASAKASVTLKFTADAGGALVVPAGTKVFAADPTSLSNTAGVVRFVTDEALTVPLSDSGTVQATAAAVGDVFNVDAGALAFLETTLTNFASVTNEAAASGGVDHQFARAAVYRVLELMYMDFIRDPEDANDGQRKLYRMMYKDELKRLVAGGVDVDRDGDGDAEEFLEHGFHRFERG